MSLTPQELIEEYQNAFEAMNNKPAPTIAYENGWFRFFPNGIRFRRARLEGMRDRLRAAATIAAALAPADRATPSPPTSDQSFTK